MLLFLLIGMVSANLDPRCLVLSQNGTCLLCVPHSTREVSGSSCECVRDLQRGFWSGLACDRCDTPQGDIASSCTRCLMNYDIGEVISLNTIMNVSILCR
jgi:hypothetical protein